MIDDSDKISALESGILTLTGGHCKSGNLIVNIPTNKLEELSEWSTEKLASLTLHLSRISKYLKSSKDGTLSASQTLPLACLADLRQASTHAVKQLAESLETVEHQQRGTISAVYFIKPRNKTRSHMLKKLLGVKPSKKHPRVPLFKVVLMKSVHELHAYIDVTQLTADFCGILRYNHVSWMHLYNVVIKCIEGCQELLTKLPSVRDKVDLLQEYETDGQTSSQVQQLLADLIEKFHIILSESSLPLYLTLSKQTLFLLDHPSSDSHLSLVHSALVEGLRSHLRGTYSELDQWNTDLEDAWRLTESRLTVLIQIHRHTERAKEIERKICEHYHPLLLEHPIVGKTLSQAELYRAHFTTTLYDPAKELLSQATEILEAVQRLKSDATSAPKSSVGRHDSTNTHSSSVISDQDISDITKCLTTSIQPFTTQLQHLQQLYVSIHIFYLLFEKALIWYKKVLKFIPESLLQRCTSNSELSKPDISQHNLTSHVRECLVYMPTEWLGAVRVFVARHPPPRQEHIDRIDGNIPQLVDRKMRSQARSLALRLQLLQRFLTSTRLPLKVVTAVLAWKTELFGPSQQEKTSGIHHSTNPTKDVTARHFPGQENHGNEKVAVRDLPRHHTGRAPEKPPRKKKLPSFDREAHTRSRPSSNLFVTSTGGVTTSSDVRGPEKSSVRKNSSRMIPRSKSVDFNFNSSSTDGSVFDYDKALVQAESGDAAKTKVAPRKSRAFTREFKHSLSHPEDKKMDWNDGQTFSNPSDVIKLESRPHNPDRVSETVSQDVQKNYASKFGRKSMYNSGTVPEADPYSSASLGYNHINLPRNEQQQQWEEKKPDPSDKTVESPNSDERFIRITFTPKQLKTNTKPAFRFDDEDLLEAAESYPVEEEEESGIDLMHTIDPYDDVVNKIREISASNLTNVEKLKQVSDLLSLSTLKRSSSQKRSVTGIRASKMSFSTLDLRATDQEEKNRKVLDSRNNSFRHNQNSEQVERSIEAVQRMKKNLAKSMEELNLSTAYSQSGNPNSYDQNPAVSSGNLEGMRYQSQLKTQHMFRKTGEVPEVIANDSQNLNAAPDFELPHHLLSRNKDNAGTRSWSDVESYSQGISASISSQDPSSYSKQSPSRYLDSPSYTTEEGSKALVSRFVPEDSALGRYPVDTFVSGDQRKQFVERPVSMSLFTGRNFISPSFLRPASSMTNLSTRGRPEITFDVEVDLEQDYQALEDLEMLQTMQEDPLSNQFSKYASNAQRKQSRDLTEENLKGEPRRGEWSESHSQNLISGKKASQGVPRLNAETVPEIRVSCLSEERSRLGHGDVSLSYLPASDNNFDRLTMEADQEHQSQEEVAESLRKTQQILEEEETRMFQRLHHLSDPSLDEEEGAGGLSHTTSLDNGYGSWASKLMYSTSSEGACRDWRKLSISSADSSAKIPRHSQAKEARNTLDEEDLEASDTVHELPWIDKPLTDPDLY